MNRVTLVTHNAYLGNVFQLLGHGDALAIMPVLLALTAVDPLHKRVQDVR